VNIPFLPLGGYKSFTPTVVETNQKYSDIGAVTIEGVGLYPMLEKPDEFNRKLRDVLEEFATKKGARRAGHGGGAKNRGHEERKSKSRVLFRVPISCVLSGRKKGSRFEATEL
jgi:hypothetical protein